MNQRLLVILAFILTSLSVGVCLAASASLKSAMRRALEAELKENLKTELAIVSKGVREPLLLGDLRQARSVLAASARPDLYTRFEIHRYEDGVGTVSLLDRLEGMIAPGPKGDGQEKDMSRSRSDKASISTTIPIFFSENEVGRWGEIRYFSSTQHIDALIQRANRWAWLLTCAIAGFIFLASTASFALFAASASWLSPLLEQYVKDGAIRSAQGTARDKVATLLFRPLLSALAHSSERLRVLRAEAESARVAKAIAGMTRMVAHDVRKPLSMTRMLVDLLKDAEDLDTMQRLTEVSHECYG